MSPVKKPVLILILLLLAVWLPGCAAKPQEFKSAAGRFAVTAPKTLQESTQDLELQAGKIALHLFSTQQDNIGYFVSYCDYPPETMAHGDLEKMLDGSRDGALSKTKGKLVSETKISLEGNPGRELVMETADESGRRAIIKGRLFMVKNRLYQVMVVAPRSQAGDKEVDQFLQSFKLVGSPG
jgi:hypothetical protein